MHKIILLFSTAIAISLNAQVNKIFTNYKASINKQQNKNLQRVIKIEIINIGNWTNFEENSFWRFVKINDGNLSQILNTDSGIIRLSENTMNTQNWKDENGNFSFRSISEPFKISQEYISAKNEKNKNKNALVEKEIYETTAPISSFTFKIYTYLKDNTIENDKDLSKTINVYSENQLIKTFTYSFEDLMKIGGISIENYKLESTESKK
ncbi:hypothetical protein [Frigoriflavimonas asaccharolytica]|uniref:Outer membrane lipoprotein-sorting protein n=1 Tax=Frigoriflavimonas asaccharolytica TaxID=2735899 RepID=A0A8J8GC49_9FLAO|nr:hypothetical protein [Frigoriflavimonas asaccharolytica]NRS93807.1 hypothetical protein [Frigoriflavimonas asaccharolytica]